MALLAAAPAAQGGVIDPALTAAMAGMKPGQEVAVILVLVDRLPLTSFAPNGVGDHNASPLLLTALKNKAAATQGSVLASAASLGGHGAIPLWAINSIALTIPHEAVAVLAQRGDIEIIRLDAVLQLPTPLTAQRSRSPDWNIQMMGAPFLWTSGATGSGIVVANLDTGVDVQHPDLAPRWRGGTNSWYDPNGQHATPYDANGHGTQTMGLIVGGGAGGTWIGMAPGAKWIAAKIFNDAGTAALSGIHQAFQWILDPDGNPSTVDSPNVVNNSWGFATMAGTCYTEFASDIAVLRAAGIGVVFAAGNDGGGAGTSESPANNAGALSVGAIDQNRNVAPYSSRGPSACGNGIFPDIVAPGDSVRTSDLTFGGIFPNSYAVVSGTSFAAPHVTGAMALLWSAHPTATLAQIESALEAATSDLGARGPDNSYGFGLSYLVTAHSLLTAGAPLAAGDSYSVGSETNLVIPAPGILVNDTSPAGKKLSAALVTLPPAGRLRLNGNGSFLYNAPNTPGSYSFFYAASDGTVRSAPATVTITVMHSAPAAHDDAFSIAMNSGPTPIDVLANDRVSPPATIVRTNSPPTSTSPEIIAAPNHGGSAVVLANGNVQYTPAPGFVGSELFTYSCRDSMGATSNIATVRLTIQ